ncbi:hypothetical protein JCM11641_000579 [Rhodosporidiobolus odoratus]
MEAAQEYQFQSAEQFWDELNDLIAVPPDSTLDELDYALRNYIAFASNFMDRFLAAPGALDHALLALLSSQLFTSHVDRMTQSIISSIVSPSASPSTLFISLMLVLQVGEGANPLTSSGHTNTARRRTGTAGVTIGSSKVFRAMRKRWKEVVTVLMKWVADAEVVEEQQEVIESEGGAGKPEEKRIGMPAEGWEERVGTAATAVLYEMCRVQKLSSEELSYFTFDFISHLFTLVERTRDAEDETFNYSLIKLIIALNEQFMVATVPAQNARTGGGNLPPPILPTVTHKASRKERGPNLVLEVLMEKEHDSKTFGENIIFILNRADGTADSLCVSLLILKILYLLFTTSGTQEFFYTNDLCVLVDVFIRELCDLGEESEGLKHTYLRVLHPLLTNTQLRQHPHKRPQLRRVLESLIAPSHYREVDPTTRRLVERNLRGSWCQGLRTADVVLGEDSGRGSTLSVDAVATAEDEGTPKKAGRHHRHKSRRKTSLDDSSSSIYSSATSSSSPYASSVTTASTSAYISSPLSVAEGHATIRPVAERSAVGDIPSPVRASHALAAVDEYVYSASPEITDAALPAASDEYASSVPSIQAGHNLLSPVASRHLSSSCHSNFSPRGGASTHPPSTASSTLAPPLVHPRPRSTSLSAATYRSFTHGLGLTDSPPPPAPPPLPPSPDPSISSASTAEYFSSTSSAAAAPTTTKRRRPPPPPPDGAPLSRPRTPSFVVPSTAASELPAPVPFQPQLEPSPLVPPGSPKVGGRRRAPPPPTASGVVGRGSPKSGRTGLEEEGVRRGVDRLAV